MLTCLLLRGSSRIKIENTEAFFDFLSRLGGDAAVLFFKMLTCFRVLTCFGAPRGCAWGVGGMVVGGLLCIDWKIFTSGCIIYSSCEISVEATGTGCNASLGTNVSRFVRHPPRNLEPLCYQIRPPIAKNAIWHGKFPHTSRAARPHTPKITKCLHVKCLREFFAPYKWFIS